MSRLDVLYVDPEVGGPELVSEPSLAAMDSGTVDLLLAAPKTISVFYALLRIGHDDREVEQVAAAHEAGVQAALRHLNRHAALGTAGERRVDTSGLRVVQLEHAAAYSATDEPPHLHTHAFVEPELQTLDGITVPLDWTGWRREVPAARALYDTVTKQALWNAIPNLRWTPGTARPELEGISPEQVEAFSGTACRPTPFRQYL